MIAFTEEILWNILGFAISFGLAFFISTVILKQSFRMTLLLSGSIIGFFVEFELLPEWSLVITMLIFSLGVFELLKEGFSRE